MVHQLYFNLKKKRSKLKYKTSESFFPSTFFTLNTNLSLKESSSHVTMYRLIIPQVLWIFLFPHTLRTFIYMLAQSLSHVQIFATRGLCPWGFPGKNMGVGCHFFFQGIFPTQGSNPHLLHWQGDFFFFFFSLLHNLSHSISNDDVLWFLKYTI